jgi:hypothetical protein
MEVRALEVGHGLKALLPYGVPLIPNQEQRDRQCRCSYEVVLAQGGEGDVCHHLNTSVNVAAEQRHNGSSISSLELAETPEVLNTIAEDNPLSFLMVH